MQTPQRPLPGAYLATPATRWQSSTPIAQPQFQRSGSSSTLAGNAQAPPPFPHISPATTVAAPKPTEPLNPIERGAKTVNDTLAQESRFPELDGYIGQGISSDYDITTGPAWAPFQKSKIYEIPDKIFEQYNQAQVSTMMGLFADIHHAWISIDNALYLWDYTHSDPELIGYEEQSHTITAVKLLYPRIGVFIPSITRLLVVATTADIILLGVSVLTDAAGFNSVTLYQTKIQTSIKNLNVNVIEGSASTGRIFFSGQQDDSVYELAYQQDDKWFSSRATKINHTSRGLASNIGNMAVANNLFGPVVYETVIQMVVDDTRSLLYTLSSKSTIRVFHMKANNKLDRVITKTLTSLFSNIGHMVSRSDLLVQGSTKIVSISPISSKEASKLHLVATTSTGCRLYLSGTSSYGWGVNDSSNGPTSMQVQHIRFPPPANILQPDGQRTGDQLVSYQGATIVDTQSKALTPARIARRFAPGYFFCFTSGTPHGSIDSVFMASPDSGRICRPQDSAQLTRFTEAGVFLSLSSRAEDIGLASPPFAAASTPVGFGNELSVQFDKEAIEIAVLTNTGVHVYRRRRLVDIFAAIIRFGGNDEGLEGDLKKFIRLYGRGETAATALAVACGESIELTSDARVARITDPEVLDQARKAFIEFGGKPILNENAVVDQTIQPIDSVRPSPRHEGISLYMSRIVRSIWKAPIIIETLTPTGGLLVNPTVSVQKLRKVQADLTKLQEFLEANKTFIDGLSGADALTQVATKQEEIALQAEHRALNSLVVLISDIIEGISFVLVLFDERTDEIILSLPDTQRQQVRQLTYETLFATGHGKELAKELVKAIVNRNIASGANVDTVAEALRRRCGSFCSAEDVVIFKAQEQLKKASEAGSGTDMGRTLLNESLKLFQQVAGSLAMEQLDWAIHQFISMEFYAGAIHLALSVAKESDRGNRALSWLTEGQPAQDSRRILFESRKRCYQLVHNVIIAVDSASRQVPETAENQFSAAARRKREAYDVIESSDDEVFHNDLYDWYLEQGWHERILEVKSPHIITYLQRRPSDNIVHADLLWKYWAQADKFHEAASVQAQLAKSGFPLNLGKRIEYLSRARANASTYTPGIGRQSRQTLMHEIADLLDIANIQDELLQKLKADPRITAERRPQVIQELDGQVLSLTDLYNGYADQASYFDICLMIYQAADHRNSADIRATWQNLLETVHKETLARGTPQPWEAVAQKVRELGTRLNLSDSVFSIPDILPMLERYAFEYQRGVGPPTWVMDVFIDLGAPYESIFPVLEAMFYNDEAPFQGSNRRFIANDMIYIVRRWLKDSERGDGMMLGGEENAASVSQTLYVLQQNGLDEPKREECALLRTRIEQLLR